MEKFFTAQMVWFIEQEKKNFIMIRSEDILNKVPDALEMLAVYNRQIAYWDSGCEKPYDED